MEPVIRQLAALHKRVIVYTKYPGLFLHYPLPNVRFTDRLTLWEKAIWTIGKIFPFLSFFIDLEDTYEKNPRVHFLHAYQQAAGLPMTHEYPRLYLDEKEKSFRLPEAGQKK